MHFLNTLKDSISSPGFYATMRERRTSQALGFLLFLSVLIATVFTAASYSATVAVAESITALPEKALALYPEDMVYTVSDGKASVMGVAEPIIIPLSQSQIVESTDPSFELGQKGADGIMIDTREPFSVEKLKAMNVIAWVAQDGIFAIKENGELQGYPYGKETSFIISKTLIASFLAFLEPWYVYIAPVLLALLFIGLFCATFFGYALFGFFVAVFVKMYYSLFLRNPIPYIQAYKTSIYAMTLPIILFYVLSYLSVSTFPFAFTLLSLGVVAWNTYEHRKAPDALPPVTTGV